MAHPEWEVPVTGQFARRALGLIIAAVATVALLPGSPASGAAKADFDPNLRMCYQPHIAGVGWGDKPCGGDIAGAPDPMHQRVDAWGLTQTGAALVCVQAYLHGFGNQNERCGVPGDPFVVGMADSGYDIGGLFWRTDVTKRLCGRVQVVFAGFDTPFWYDPSCAYDGFSGGFSGQGRITALVLYFEQ